MVIPYLEVSHLASSSSFFAAVLQPLGLRYLDTQALHGSYISVVFGANDVPVLQIRQSTSPRLSSLVLSAPSRSAVTGFRTSVLRANPALTQSDGAYYRATSSTTARAAAFDLDGNTIEVIYSDPLTHRSSEQRGGSTNYISQPTTSRILEWNHNAIATPLLNSHPHMEAQGSKFIQAPPSPHAHSYIEPYYTTLKNTNHEHYAPEAPEAPEVPVSVSPRQSTNSGGFSATTMVGALFGAAAGVALTYGLVSREKEKQRIPRHESGPIPALPRRATFPERPSQYRWDQHRDPNTPIDGWVSPKDGYENDGEKEYTLPAKYLIHNSNHISPGDVPYGSVEDTPPLICARATDGGFDTRGRRSSNRPQAIEHDYGTQSRHSSSRTQALEPSFDTRSRRSSRCIGGHSSSRRSRSEATTSRASVPKVHDIRKSDASSKYSRADKDKDTLTAMDISGRDYSPAYQTGAARTSASWARDGNDGHSYTSRRRSTVPSPVPLMKTDVDHQGYASSRRSAALGDPACWVGSGYSRGVPHGNDQSITSNPWIKSDYDQRTRISSRHTKSHHSANSRSHQPSYDVDRETYISARTHPSSSWSNWPEDEEVAQSHMRRPCNDVASTGSPGPPNLVASNMSAYKVPLPQSMATSYLSSLPPSIASSYMRAREVPLPPSLAPSCRSARDVALPRSGVGSSHADWDDDLESIVPGDSISNVGSKTNSRRSRRHR